MALLQSAALTGYRNYTKRTVSYARYKVGSTWYTVELSSCEILSTGIVRITFMIELQDMSGTITQVQLYDKNGNLWLDKTEALNLSDVSEGFLYVVQIEIKEVTSE